MHLLERGVRLTGTDGWSWDAPFVHTRREVRALCDARLIWEGHKAGRDIGYCHLEKLHNLEVLPADGFHVICFPVKIRAASAGWTRAVAIRGSMRAKHQTAPAWRRCAAKHTRATDRV